MHRLGDALLCITVRKTVTFSDFVLEVAEQIGNEEAAAAAVEELTGKPPATSESARIDQLASIGAARVLALTMSAGYEDLAALLVSEPPTRELQRTLGKPIEDETDAGVETLQRALAELDR